MSIVIAPATDRLAWDAYIDSNPLAGPYHRHAWLEAVSRAYGFGVAPLAAVRDGRIVGILPMVRFSLPARAGRWISLPYCDYGGPLATEETVRARLLEYAMALAREKGDVLVALRSRSEGGQAGGKVLMRLALPQGSEPLLRTFPAKLRSQILKPTRDGLTAVSGGEELLPAFYSVFARNMRDLGSPTHSLAWFQAVARGFGPQCRVWLVRLPDGQPAAAGMTLCQGRQTCLPWASSVRQYNRTNANMLLYWAMLGKAADDGQVVFDFGRSTPGSGTYRFKAQWGARESGLEWATCDAATGLIRSGTSPSSPNGLRTLAASCWRRLPLAVANLVGPRLRRHISL
jgi:FemAB-related protein (PEP-CTERM system-associated)